jgi:hypothetical protein
VVQSGSRKPVPAGDRGASDSSSRQHRRKQRRRLVREQIIVLVVLAAALAATLVLLGLQWLSSGSTPSSVHGGALFLSLEVHP